MSDNTVRNDRASEPSDGTIIVDVCTPEQLARTIFNGIVDEWNQGHPDNPQEYAPSERGENA